MQLHDRKIKSIIREWQQQEKDPEFILSHFKKEVELYIYNFPRLAYKKDLDECSEFYLYVLDQLESIINNYPLEADIQFKTWFNYVLRNKFLDYYHKNKKNKVAPLSLDDYEEELTAQTFTDEQCDFAGLKQGLNALGPHDRLLIKLYYLPESIDQEDLKSCVQLFQIPLHEILDIRKDLIDCHLQELDRIRELSQKLSSINEQLQDKKYRLYQSAGLDSSEQNTYLIQISRLESSRYRLLQKIYAPHKKTMNSFMRLFSNVNKARYRLSMAQKKLRFELLRKKRSLSPGGLL